MDIRAAAKSDLGMKRTENQDAVHCDSVAGLFIVADGLGGHNAGEVASQLAIEVITSQLKKRATSGMDWSETLRSVVERAGKRIFDKAVEHPEMTGMGTTITAAMLRNKELHFAQVGDSRAYLIRPPHVWQLTEDHSLVQEQVRAGVLSPEKAQTHQYKNIITRSLGNEPHVAVDLYARRPQKNDVYLLCSDGLTGHVKINELCEIVEKNMNNLDNALKVLIDTANARGGEDNCSVVLLHIKGL